MRDLFLTYAASRYTYGGRTYNFPSRFLTDLGHDPYTLLDDTTPASNPSDTDRDAWDW
jgi:superfamily I DNA/RNA helicase